MPSHPEIPRHIAIIMDGNGRWAKERGLPRLEGHRSGAESVREVMEACIERAKAGIYKYKTRATVDGFTVAEAELMCTMRKVD